MPAEIRSAAYRIRTRSYTTGKALRDFTCSRGRGYHCGIDAHSLRLHSGVSGWRTRCCGTALGESHRDGRCGPDYPAGTLVVNIVGSTAMGMLAAWFAFRGETTTAGERLFLTTGVLGGFTTFSAFALDTRLMWERHDVAGALIYAGASVMLSVLGLIAGMFIVRVPLS